MGDRKDERFEAREESHADHLAQEQVSQREISRKAGIDRKTIRKYGRQFDIIPFPEKDDFSPPDELVATGSDEARNSKSPTPATGDFTGYGKDSVSCQIRL